MQRSPREKADQIRSKAALRVVAKVLEHISIIYSRKSDSEPGDELIESGAERKEKAYIIPKDIKKCTKHEAKLTKIRDS